MNLRQLRELAYNMADEESGDIYPASLVDSFINLSIALVARSIPQNVVEEEITLNESQASYSLTNPVIEGKDSIIEGVLNSAGDRLTYKDVKLFPNPSIEGTPSSWSPEGGNIRLYPVPGPDQQDDVYAVTYQKEQTELTSEAAEPNLSLAAQELVLVHAVYLMKMKDDEFTSADRWRDEFEYGLRKLAGPQTGVWSASL